MVTITPPATVFDALSAALQSAAAYNQDDVVPPAAILWTDEKREWERLLPRLRLALPHLLTFGPYDSDSRHRPGDLAPVRPGGQGSRVAWPAGTVPSSTCPASAGQPCGRPRSARRNSGRSPSCSTGASSGPSTTARTGPSRRSSRPRRAG